MEMLPCSGPSSSLMIIGDYPTRNEWESERAYGGSIGSLFNQLLKPFRRTLSSTYATYLVKKPIPGFESKAKKTRDEAWTKAWESYDWVSLLKSEISMTDPNVILVFGEKPLNLLTGHKKVNKQRGSIFNLLPDLAEKDKHIKVVPILSPRSIIQDNYRPIQYTQWDINKALQYVNSKAPFREPGTVWIAKTHQELANYWERARYGEFLTFDIETYPGIFITCISFCADGKEAVSVPLLFDKMDYQERAYIYKLISRILAHPIPKVAQNTKYDWTKLEEFGFKIKNIIGDTMLMAHTIYPEFPKGLDFLNSIYTEVPYYKDEGKDYDPRQHNPSQLLKYNAKDSLVTWNIWKAQQKDAKIQGVHEFFHKRVMPTFFIYKKMDQIGIRVDDTQRQKLLRKYIDVYENSLIPLKLFARDSEFTTASYKKVGKFLYDTLGIRPRYHQTPTGQMSWSTDEDTLDNIVIKDNLDPGRFKLVLSIKFVRKLEKILGLLQTNISRDGRMRMSSKIHGTETGRTSNGKSLETLLVIDSKGNIISEKCGWPFQTFGKRGFKWNGVTYGKDLRSIFVADEGWRIISGDQKGAEARIVCVLSEDYETLQIMDTDRRGPGNEKLDIHTFTAFLILHKPEYLVTPEERQEIGKTGRHAGNYNEGPGSLMLRTHKPFPECSEILGEFHKSVPKVRGIFHTQIREQINSKHLLVSPHGRRRDFHGQINEDVYKEAFATIPQATVSDHSKQTVMVALDNQWSNNQAIPFCEAHDGLDYLVRSECVDDFLVSFNQAMLTPIDFRGCSLPRDFMLTMPGEYEMSEIGGSWADLKEVRVR